ncbi:mercuric reductase [Oculatella sp. LEGE 06141]|uniref:mercuric reductase n=1 Tax=Oculatella sp. LEGE 06141 TaxID=1828648 RepID=UPI0018812D35|nr:mercuric reductase [Oculatella sp. LEGE 06141]MBE9180585.1 mercuric reductase [Oculatella sp. LEGE 06141]
MTNIDTRSVTVQPMDQYNQTLVANLHPSNWVNPKPASRYNLVVIGAGTAGLVTAAGAALVGAKVALIEKHLMGGDCTNTGCVPSKTLIRSARAVADVHQAHRFGVSVPDGTHVDFAAVMERLRQVRATISKNDSVQRFCEMGVDVFLGQAHFSGSDTVEVAGQSLRFKKAVIATGSRAAQLPIEGLAESGYLTNETVFSLTECPKRLSIIGGGYIGCELAQTFRRLGAEVILLQKGSRLLASADADAAQIIQRQFEQEDIQVVLDAKTTRIERHGAEKRIYYQRNGHEETIVVDELLVAAGRSPNIDGLNLEAVGVNTDSKKGVLVNEFLQTSNPRIYAVGDVCMSQKFTHAADAAARRVVRNALFSPLGIGRQKLSQLVIPWCAYTDPEIAHVGLSDRAIQQQADQVETLFVSLDDVDRAIADGEIHGFAKIHLKKGSDKILGATVVARHAGEMINEITLAMTRNLGLGAVANTIHPYPTQAEVIRKAADEYSFSQFTPFIKKLFSTWLQWQR